MKQRKALVICFKDYKGIKEGGGMANQRNIDMARSILGSGNVDVYYVHKAEEKRSLLDMAKAFFLLMLDYYNGLTPSKVNKLCELAKGYDYVFVSTTVFGIICKSLKRVGYAGKIIAHFHNVESLYYSAIISKFNPVRPFVLSCVAHNDGFCCKYADKTIALNQRDSDILKRMYGRGADIITPIALQDRFEDSKAESELMTSRRPLCSFIGSCFPANNEGLLWFVRNVLPHVDINFRVVGKGMAMLKESCPELKDIEVVSDAPDLGVYYVETDFMILPVFSGSGMKVKTCESLMYGKNILGSSETFEGYDIDVKRVGGLCNTAKEYIDRINYFIQHPVPRFNQYSREVYKEKYSDKATCALFAKVFD